jgi:hypothetical protein
MRRPDRPIEEICTSQEAIDLFYERYPALREALNEREEDEEDDGNEGTTTASESKTTINNKSATTAAIQAAVNDQQLPRKWALVSDVDERRFVEDMFYTNDMHQMGIAVDGGLGKLVNATTVVESEIADPLGFGRIDTTSMTLIDSKSHRRHRAVLGALGSPLSPRLGGAGIVNTPKSEQFDVERFLLVYKDRPYEELRTGHLHLQHLITQHMQNLRVLVKDNFGLFVKCREITDEIYTRLKQSGLSDEVNTLALLVSKYAEMERLTTKIFLPLLLRKKEEDKIRAMVEAVTTFRLLLDIPMRLHEAILKGDMERAIYEYRRVKGVTAPPLLLSKVREDVSIAIAELEKNLLDELAEPFMCTYATAMQRETTIHHLLSLNAKTDPAFHCMNCIRDNLEDQFYTWISTLRQRLERARALSQKAMASMDSKASTSMLLKHLHTDHEVSHDQRTKEEIIIAASLDSMFSTTFDSVRSFWDIATKYIAGQYHRTVGDSTATIGAVSSSTTTSASALNAVASSSVNTATATAGSGIGTGAGIGGTASTAVPGDAWEQNPQIAPWQLRSAAEVEGMMTELLEAFCEQLVGIMTFSSSRRGPLVPPPPPPPTSARGRSGSRTEKMLQQSIGATNVSTATVGMEKVPIDPRAAHSSVTVRRLLWLTNSLTLLSLPPQCMVTLRQVTGLLVTRYIHALRIDLSNDLRALAIREDWKLNSQRNQTTSLVWHMRGALGVYVHMLRPILSSENVIPNAHKGHLFTDAAYQHLRELLLTCLDIIHSNAKTSPASLSVSPWKANSRYQSQQMNSASYGSNFNDNDDDDDDGNDDDNKNSMMENAQQLQQQAIGESNANSGPEEEVRLLVSMNNLAHLTSTIVPDIMVCMKQACAVPNYDVTASIPSFIPPAPSAVPVNISVQEVENAGAVLHDSLFSAFLAVKSRQISSLVRIGMLCSGYDWNGPHNVECTRDFVIAVLSDLVCVHSTLFRIDQRQLSTVMSALIKAVLQSFIRCIRAIDFMSTDSKTQTELDASFLKAKTSKFADSTCQKMADTLISLIKLKTVAPQPKASPSQTTLSVAQLLKSVAQQTRFQFVCLQA